MDRSPALKRALLAGALALCAHVAFAQDTAPAVAASVSLPVEASVALPVDASIALPVAATVGPPAASSIAVPGAPSVELPVASSIAVPVEAGAQTEAESDYDALYGVDATSIVDPTLPPPAELPQAFDPWEPFNRKVHRFNDVVDRTVARPLARFYMAVLPRPVRLGVSNFFSNLAQPLTAVNALLQGKPKQAGQAIGRFALNATLGIGGVFDPASDAKIPHNNEDFGQTLGVWGWKQSRYVELPLFGPRTVRDMFGMASDAPFGLVRQVESDKLRIFLQGLNLVDVRTQLMSVDAMREGAADDYTLVRDAWLQRRHYQIFGDRQFDEDQSLPEYLRDDTQPAVPVDAIPVTPMDGG